MEALKRSLGFSQAPSNGPGATSRDYFNEFAQFNGRISAQNSVEDDNTLQRNPAKVKSKLLSMWNNVKYGKTLFSLDPAVSSFSSHSAVWLLGIFYHRRNQDYTPQVSSSQERDLTLEAFMADFSSRIWLTYRREFEEFQGTSMNTDCGWGCMIRSGQMMVANALLIHSLGRNWRWKLQNMHPVVTGHDVCDESVHRSIVRLFGDSPNESISPFSIHQLVSIAETVLDRKPGDWFGPAATAHLLKAALDKTARSIKKIDQKCLSNFKIYVAQDTTVYRQDVLDLCVRSNNSSKENSPNFEETFEEEGFSILNRESAEILIAESGQNESSHLHKSENAGVPYFSDVPENFVRIEREQVQQSSIPEDTVKYMSLQGQISVDGEEWTVETPSDQIKDPAHTNRLYPSLTQEFLRKESLGEDLTWSPVLVLVPVRLGSESRLNPLYGTCIQALLADPTCIGIIGGRPKHSLYFVGFQDDNLIHLDPHLVQDRVDVFRDSFSLNSFHCSTPRKMALTRMDPSCCFGFLLTSRWQFDAWCEMTKDLVLPHCPQNQVYPMFSIEEGRAKDVEMDSRFLDRLKKFETFVSEPSENLEPDNYGTEDFVFL